MDEILAESHWQSRAFNGAVSLQANLKVPRDVGQSELREVRQCQDLSERRAGPASLTLLAPAYSLFSGL